MALRSERGLRVLLCNFTHEPQTVRVNGLNGGVSLRSLDEHCFQTATCDPDAFRREGGQTATTHAGGLTTTLAPFALLRIDTLS
jgi:hypothetical protein